VASLFEPFTRLDGRVSNRHGVGLGLSIVASVVNAHHGNLVAEALPSGGMKISARIPKVTAGTSPGNARRACPWPRAALSA
jgi:K+-sensing histidine kinase KdpD